MQKSLKTILVHFISSHIVSVPAVHCESFIVWRFNFPLSPTLVLLTYMEVWELNSFPVNGMQRMQLPDLPESKAKIKVI